MSVLVLPENKHKTSFTGEGTSPFSGVPIMSVGFMVMRSILFSFANLNASFSARVLATMYPYKFNHSTVTPGAVNSWLKVKRFI